MIHPLTKSANGKSVYAQLINSAVSEKISREPHLLTLAEELLAEATLEGEHIVYEHDMKRVVSNTEVVETKEGDIVFYAQAKKSPIYTRFVKHRKIEPTSYLTLHLQKDEAGDYELIDIAAGKMIPPKPGEEGADERSLLFWKQHAVVMNGQPILAKTTTKDCPY